MLDETLGETVIGRDEVTERLFELEIQMLCVQETVWVGANVGVKLTNPEGVDVNETECICD